MFITRKALPRRTFLQGMGVTLALPMLDAMVPAAAAMAQLAARRPRRVGFVYVPHGADMATWTPPTSGAGFELSPTLKAGGLEPFRDSLLVITNLRRAGSQLEMHAAASCGWLSGAVPKRTEGEDYRAGITIDQVLATQIGQSSPFPSIELATEDYTGYVGGCTPGFACAYMNTIAWAGPSRPLPMEINPRAAFERLFGDGGSDAQRRQLMQEDRSLLDAIAGDVRRLQTQLSPRDRVRMSDYLDNVREIERRIQRTEAQNTRDVELSSRPLGIPAAFQEHTALMFDLMAMSYRLDLTRVSTFMMSRESSQRTFPEIGINEPWHPVSHHNDQPAKLAENAAINAMCLRLFASFLETLQKTDDGDGTLLDHTLVFYGSGMGNSNVHATDPLPMLAVGGGRRNRHVVLPERTQIGNLWLSLAHSFDAQMDRFGDSTGTVDVL